jgi:hypothetical protein
MCDAYSLKTRMAGIGEVPRDRLGLSLHFPA